MSMIDLSRIIYDRMPKIPVLPDGKSIEELDLDAFVGPGAVISVDLPTPLRPKGFDFPVHRMLLGNEVLIAENVTNLGAIAGRKSRIMALPLKVQGSDAAHARIVAEV